MKAAGITLAAVALAFATSAIAQDKAKPAAEKPKAAAETKASAGQGTRKVLIDNEKVIVVETRYKPGEASEMRERNARVTRALTSGDMERTYADGKKEKVTYKTGQVRINEASPAFTTKNIGKSEIKLYIVQVK